MGLRDPVRMLVIDAANVIGSRPTGWWRDRPGAKRVFTEQVRATVTAGRLGQPVTIVLERGDRGLSRCGRGCHSLWAVIAAYSFSALHFRS